MISLFMPFGDRVQQAMKRQGMDETALAHHSGLSLKTISRYLSRTDAPNRETNVSAIASALSVNQAWLETGEGEMLLPGQENGEKSGRPSSDLAGVADTDLVHVPEVLIEASAGEGTDPTAYELEEFNGELRLPGWYIRAEYGVEPARVRQIRTRGNSMQPTIYPGQRLLVAIWEGEPLQDGLVYVVYGPHGLMIKRLFLREDDDGQRWVIVSSDNRKRVEPFRVPAERFADDYRIVAVALEINRKL